MRQVGVMLPLAEHPTEDAVHLPSRFILLAPTTGSLLRLSLFLLLAGAALVCGSLTAASLGAALLAPHPSPLIQIPKPLCGNNHGFAVGFAGLTSKTS